MAVLRITGRAAGRLSPPNSNFYVVHPPKLSQLDTEHCGYSTNPSYSAELIKLVNLYRLNDPRALEWYATGQDPGAGYGTRDSGHGTIPPVAQIAQSGAVAPVSLPTNAGGNARATTPRIVCDPEIGQ